MKKIIILAAAMVFAAAGVAMAGVSGTPHDLSGGTGEICVACHTPHGADTSVVTTVLWNRVQAAQTYNVYSSATFDMDAPVPAITEPQSLACLVCHNGVASTLTNYPGTGNTLITAIYNVDVSDLTSGESNLGLDLRNDHPVGFVYNNLADTTNNFPAATGGIINGTYGDYPLYGASNNTFECATCHDVHNSVILVKAPTYFLRANNTQSNMCGDCHVTKK